MANQPTKYKKFLAGAASATLVATAIVPTALAAEVENAATDFSDVAATHTHYAAIMQAVERELFDGYTDGTFKPENSIDRKGVVKSLAKYVIAQSEYKTFEEYITANKLADKVTPFTDVPATHGDAELFNASLIVKDSGIFTGSNNNLMPANVITRQQMAKVLVNGFGLKDLAGVESEVTDTDKAQAEYVNFINILSENKVTEVTTFNPTGAVKRGQMASFLNRAFDAAHTVVAPETATKVVSVSATNLKEVVVAFDGTVDKASAENKASYNLKYDTSNVAIKSARLQADGKSVVLTLDTATLENQEVHTLTVTNVKTSDKAKTVSAKDFEFTPVDAALPTVEKVEGLGNKAVKVTFSEPVNLKSTVAGTFKLDDKVVSGILSGNGTRTVIIELFTTQTTGKHTLSINNQVEDFAGYNLVATSVDFDVVEDVTAPTVVEVKDVTLESATVVFSEDVKDAEAVKGSNYYWMNGSTKHAADAKVEKIDGKTFKLTFSNDHKLPAVATDLYITNVVDYSGNKIADDTKVSISPVIDQTRPEVVSAIFADTNDKLTLTFNKNINPSTFKSTNVVLKDEDGKAVKDYGYTISETGTSSRTLTVNFSSELDAGTYTFELTGIQDTTTLKNTALPIVETLEVADVSKPSVTSVTGDKNVYFVNFDAAMDISSSASVLNPENYYVKYVQSGVTKTGKLPASTNLTPVNGNKGVIITLPSNVTKLDEITIQGVKGANGSYLDGFSVKYGDSTNPIVNTFDVVRVNATAKDKLLVKFNQPVSSVDKSQISVANPSLSVESFEIQADNTVVELTLSGDLADTNATSASLSYSATAFKSLSDREVTATTKSVLDSIAPEVVKDVNGKITVATTGTPGILVNAAGEKITVNFQEAVKAKNIANVRDNFKLYQANGLALEYGVDYVIDATTSTALSGAGTSAIVLDLSGSSYDGALNVQFDNSNANIVDESAVKTNGADNTALAAASFDTRTSGSTTGSTITTAVAPTLTAAYNASSLGTPEVPAVPAVQATADVDFGTDLSGTTNNDALKLTAVATGAAGNGIKVEFVNATDNAVTTATFDGTDTLTVELSDDGSGAAGTVDATTLDVVNAINAVTGASKVVTAAVAAGTNGSELAAVKAAVTTAGGANLVPAVPAVPAGAETLVLTFSEAMNTATLDAANEIVIKSGTTVRTLGTNPTFVWSTGNTVLTITTGTSNDVVANDTITSVNAKDVSGNAVNLVGSDLILD